MNQEQVKSAVRSVVLFLAGLVGGMGVSKGWYSPEQLASFLNSEFVGSVAAFLFTAGWGVWMNSKRSLMTATAKVAPEATIIAPHADANAIPLENVVAPGTLAAKEAAKA